MTDQKTWTDLLDRSAIGHNPDISDISKVKDDGVSVFTPTHWDILIRIFSFTLPGKQLSQWTGGWVKSLNSPHHVAATLLIYARPFCGSF